MAGDGVILLDMATKRKGGEPKKNGKQPNRKPSYTVFARVKPAIGDVMEAFLEDTEPRTSVSAVVELALAEFFISRGYMPAKTKAVD